MSEQYPHAPLVQAICEVRFHGETAIESARPRIQKELRDSLPLLFVPKAKPDVAVALQPYVFMATDQTEQFHCALNSFAYITKRYSGYAKYRERLLGLARQFSEIVPEVQELTRVGLRYINHIPILRESKEAAIPLEDYLTVGLKLPPSIGATLTQLESTFTVRLAAGTLKVMLRVEEGASAVGPERLVLDFDFAQLDDLQMTRLPEYLDVAHEQTKRVFTDLVSDRYLPVMRGNTQ